MPSIGNLTLTLNVDGKEKLVQAQANVAGLQQGFTNAQAGMTTLSVAFMAINQVIANTSRIVSATVNDFIKAETASVALESALDKAGYQAEYASEAFKEVAKQLQNNSAYEDDEIIRMQSLLLSYGNTGRETLKLIPILVDLASKMSLASGETESLQSAYNVYIQLLNGAERGARKYGINLDDVTVKSKDAVAITNALADAVSGASAQYAQSAQGSLEQYKNEIGNLREAMGLFVKSEAFQGFIFFLREMIKKATPDESPLKPLVDNLKTLGERLPALNDDMTDLKDKIATLTTKDQPELIRRISEELSKSADTLKNPVWNEYKQSIAASSKSINDYTISLAIANAELDKNTKTTKEDTEATGQHNEAILQGNALFQERALTMDAYASKQQIIAANEAALGLNTKASAEQMGQAAQVMRDSLLPLDMMAEMTAASLANVFSGEYTLSQSFRQLGNQMLAMLTQMLIKAILLQTVFKIIGLITGGLGNIAQATAGAGAAIAGASLSNMNVSGDLGVNSIASDSISGISGGGVQSITIQNYTASPFSLSPGKDAETLVEYVNDRLKVLNGNTGSGGMLLN